MFPSYVCNIILVFIVRLSSYLMLCITFFYDPLQRTSSYLMLCIIFFCDPVVATHGHRAKTWVHYVSRYVGWTWVRWGGLVVAGVTYACVIRNRCFLMILYVRWSHNICRTIGSHMNFAIIISNGTLPTAVVETWFTVCQIFAFFQTTWYLCVTRIFCEILCTFCGCKNFVIDSNNLDHR